MKSMTLNNFICVLAGLGLAGVISTNAQAAEKEKLSPEVQAKVTQAIKVAFSDAVIGEMAKGKEDGLDVITVIFTSKSNKMDADVTPDGILVGTEGSADISTFPKPAAKALKKATKGMKTTFEIARTFAKAQKDASGGMTVTKLANPIVAYEADVEKDGQKGEFGFNAAGALLECPKWATAGSKEKGKKSEKEGKDDKD
jgi:hypothetical protein